jgi:ribonuclease Z
MNHIRPYSEIRLVNGSIGDPVLFIDYPGKDDALLFDCGDNDRLPLKRLSDLAAVFISHHHMDHFVGFDRVLRANLDRDKTLHVFGPEGTIRRIYSRITSYEIQFFAFQKLVLKVHEVLSDRLRVALLECVKHFPEPEIAEVPWSKPLLYENADVQVEACHADHVVPCLSYALVERTGYHPDAARLGKGALRPGPWVGEALALLRADADPATALQIQGGRFTLASLRDQYFEVSEGTRTAFVTDTAWNAKVRPRLVRLAKGATRLYCDCYYASSEVKQAGTHRHMIAPQSAEFAKLADVKQLILMHFGPRYAGHYQLLIDEARAIFPDARAELGST